MNSLIRIAAIMLALSSNAQAQSQYNDYDLERAGSIVVYLNKCPAQAEALSPMSKMIMLGYLQGAARVHGDAAVREAGERYEKTHYQSGQPCKIKQ
jgi:hypothetical protein